MPNIEDQLQKKKPFKKKTYRSYLSLDETLEDVEHEKAIVSHSTDIPPLSNKTEPQVIISPEVTFSPAVHISPEVILSPEAHISPKVIIEPEVEILNSPNNSSKEMIKENLNSNNINILDSIPQVQNSPQVIFSPEVSFAPDYEIGFNSEHLKNSLQNNLTELLKETEPQVTFSPEVSLSPKVQESPQVDFSSPKQDKKTLGHFKNSKKFTSASKEENSNEHHQHAAVDNLIVHTMNLFKGFTRVPNSILQVLISGELTKHELQTLAVVLRLTIGFNRDEAPISLGVIQSLTGIQSSRISAALNVLIDKNLIKRKSGSINTPNLISVVFSDETSKVITQPKVQKSPQVTNAPQMQKSPETLGEKITVDLGLESHLQYIYNINKDTLSLSADFQSKYLGTMLKKEKERVFNLLKELKQIPNSDIETVLADVFENKIDTLGQPINSEIGYLETCFFKHSNWLKTRQNEKQKNEESKKRAEYAIKAEELQQQQESERWNKVVQAFNQKFKTEIEQNAIIEKYASKMTGPYSSIVPARRSFAIKEWFEELISEK